MEYVSIPVEAYGVIWKLDAINVNYCMEHLHLYSVALLRL